MTRRTPLFAFEEASPLPPREFINLVYPSWARVFIEITTQHRTADIGWHSDEVRQSFLRLAGFDPFRVQYADLPDQLAALQACADLVEALFQADEVWQLDGDEAIEFAAGWMTARAWLEFQPTDTKPSDELLDLAGRQAVASSGTSMVDKFMDGFKTRAGKSG